MSTTPIPIGNPPVIPIDPKTGQADGTAIYDMLMAKIEPDLVTLVIPTLDEKYKTETPEERKARGLRYKDAFEKYDVAYREYMDGMKSGITKFQRDALHSVEQDNRADEQTDLDNLTSAISTL